MTCCNSKAVRTAIAIAITAASSSLYADTVTTDGSDIVIKTKGGLAVATADDAFEFKLGGRLQADYDRFDGLYTKNGKTADAAYLRGARLELSHQLEVDHWYRAQQGLRPRAMGERPRRRPRHAGERYDRHVLPSCRPRPSLCPASAQASSASVKTRY